MSIVITTFRHTKSHLWDIRPSPIPQTDLKDLSPVHEINEIFTGENPELYLGHGAMVIAPLKMPSDYRSYMLSKSYSKNYVNVT